MKYYFTLTLHPHNTAILTKTFHAKHTKFTEVCHFALDYLLNFPLDGITNRSENSSHLHVLLHHINISGIFKQILTFKIKTFHNVPAHKRSLSTAI